MIARIYNWLFCACKHEWEIHREVALWGAYAKFNDPKEIPIGAKIILRCKHCGNIKARRI